MADPAPALIADLIAAFPLDRVPPETGRIYLRSLQHLPPHVLAHAVAQLIFTARRFPPISAILEAAAEYALGLPSEHEALQQAYARVAWGRTGTGQPPAVNAIVAAAIGDVGGYHAFRASDSPSVIRGQFLKLYRDQRAQAIRSYQAGSASLTSGSQAIRALS